MQKFWTTAKSCFLCSFHLDQLDPKEDPRFKIIIIIFLKKLIHQSIDYGIRQQDNLFQESDNAGNVLYNLVFQILSVTPQVDSCPQEDW